MKNIFLIIILLIGNYTFSQVLFSDTKDTIKANKRSVIELRSTGRGVLFPRLTTEQREKIFEGKTKDSTYTSMLVYDKDLKQFMYWTSTNWKPIYFSEELNEIFNSIADNKALKDSVKLIRRGLFDSLWVSGKTRLGIKNNDSTIVYNILRIIDYATFDKNITLSGNLIKNIGRAQENNDLVSLIVLQDSLKKIRKRTLKYVTTLMLKDSIASIREYSERDLLMNNTLSDTMMMLRKGNFDSLKVSKKVRLGVESIDSTIVYNTLYNKNSVIIKDKLGIGIENLNPEKTLHVKGDVTITGKLTVDGQTNISSISTNITNKKIFLAYKSTSDVTSDSGGVILKGSTPKSILWYNSNKSWNFSEQINILSGKVYFINGKNINQSKVLNNVAYLDTKNEFSKGMVLKDTLSVNNNNIVNIGRANNSKDAINLNLLMDSIKNLREGGTGYLTLKRLSDTAKVIKIGGIKTFSDTAKIVRKRKFDSIYVFKKIRFGKSKKDTTIVYNTFKSKRKSIFIDTVGIGTERPKYPFHLEGNSKIEGNINVSDLEIYDDYIYFNNSSDTLKGIGVILKNPISDKSILWYDTNKSWNFSENINILKDKEYFIDDKSINKSKVLSNVVYLDTTNIFKKSISINDTITMNNNRIVKVSRAKDTLDAINLIQLKDTINLLRNNIFLSNLINKNDFLDSIVSIRRGYFDSLQVLKNITSSRLFIDSSKLNQSSINLRNGNKYGVYKDGDLAYQRDSLWFMNKGKKINLLGQSLDLNEGTNNYSGITSNSPVETSLDGKAGIPLCINNNTGKYDIASNTNIDSNNVIAITIDESKTPIRKVLRQGYLYNPIWNFTEIGKPIYLDKNGIVTPIKPEIGKYIQQIGTIVSNNIIYFDPLGVSKDEVYLSISNSRIKIVPEGTNLTYTIIEKPEAQSRKWFYKKSLTGKLTELTENNNLKTIVLNKFTPNDSIYYIICKSTFWGGYEKESPPAQLIICKNTITPDNEQYIKKDINGNSLTANVKPSTGVTYSWRYDINPEGDFVNIVGTSPNYIPNFSKNGNYYIKCVATKLGTEFSSNIVKVIINNSILTPAVDQIIEKDKFNTKLKQEQDIINPRYWFFSNSALGPFTNEITDAGTADSLKTNKLPVGINYIVATNKSDKTTNPVKITVFDLLVIPSATQRISKFGTGSELKAIVRPTPDSKGWYIGNKRDSINTLIGIENTYTPKGRQTDSFFVAFKAKFGSVEKLSNIVKIEMYKASIKDGVREKFIKINSVKDTIKPLYEGNPSEIVWQAKKNNTPYYDVSTNTTLKWQVVPKQEKAGEYFYRARIVYGDFNVFSDSVRVVVNDYKTNYSGESALYINKNGNSFYINGSYPDIKDITFQWMQKKGSSEMSDIPGQISSYYVPNFADTGEYITICKIIYKSSFTGTPTTYFLFSDTTKFLVLNPTFAKKNNETVNIGEYSLSNRVSGIINNCLKENPNVTWALKNNTNNTIEKFTLPMKDSIKPLRFNNAATYKMFYNFIYKNKLFNSDTQTIICSKSNDISIDKKQVYVKYDINKSYILSNNIPTLKSSTLNLNEYTINWFLYNYESGEIKMNNTGISIIEINAPKPGIYDFYAKLTKNNNVIQSQGIKLYALSDTITTAVAKQLFTDTNQIKVSTNGKCQLIADSVRWYNKLDNKKIPTLQGGNKPIFYPLYFTEIGNYQLACYTYYKGIEVDAKFNTNNSPIVIVYNIKSLTPIDSQFMTINNQRNVVDDRKVGTTITSAIDIGNYTDFTRQWYICKNDNKPDTLNDTKISGQTNKTYTPKSADFTIAGKYYFVYCAYTFLGNITKTSNTVKIIVPDMCFVQKSYPDILPNGSVTLEIKENPPSTYRLSRWSTSLDCITYTNFSNYGNSYNASLNSEESFKRVICHLIYNDGVNIGDTAEIGIRKIDSIAFETKIFKDAKEGSTTTLKLKSIPKIPSNYTTTMKWLVCDNGGTFTTIENTNMSDSYEVTLTQGINVKYVIASCESNYFYYGVPYKSYDTAQVGYPAAGNEYLIKPKANTVISVLNDNTKVFWDGEWTYLANTIEDSKFASINYQNIKLPDHYSKNTLMKNCHLDNIRMQMWSPIIRGTYQITACGAAGGSSLYKTKANGGEGIEGYCIKNLQIKDTLRILVGEKAHDSDAQDTSQNAGGGGGTFVVKFKNTLKETDSTDIIIIAGGGGGACGNSLVSEEVYREGIDGQSTKHGSNGYKSLYGLGGRNGNGGYQSVYKTSSNDGLFSGAGGGFFTNGINPMYPVNFGNSLSFSGYAFIKKGIAGFVGIGEFKAQYNVACAGGYGGGGATTRKYYSGGGGGGGYSGGGGGGILSIVSGEYIIGLQSGGGGGGSYNLTPTGNYSTGDGYVKIKYKTN